MALGEQAAPLMVLLFLRQTEFTEIRRHRTQKIGTCDRTKVQARKSISEKGVLLCPRYVMAYLGASAICLT